MTYDIVHTHRINTNFPAHQYLLSKGLGQKAAQVHQLHAHLHSWNWWRNWFWCQWDPCEFQLYGQKVGKNQQIDDMKHIQFEQLFVRSSKWFFFSHLSSTSVSGSRNLCRRTANFFFASFSCKALAFGHADRKSEISYLIALLLLYLYQYAANNLNLDCVLGCINMSTHLVVFPLFFSSYLKPWSWHWVGMWPARLVARHCKTQSNSQNHKWIGKLEYVGLH